MKILGYLILAALIIALSLPLILRLNHRDKLKNKQNSEVIQGSNQANSGDSIAPFAPTSINSISSPDSQQFVKQETPPKSNTNSGATTKDSEHGGGWFAIIITIIVVLVIVGFKVKSRNRSNSGLGMHSTKVRNRASRVGTLGAIGNCKMCGIPIFGEETVVNTQKQAVYVEKNMFKAEWVEQQSGYRCTSCRSEYCKECLEKYAPANYSGGKACPSCHGNFEIIHG